MASVLATTDTRQEYSALFDIYVPVAAAVFVAIVGTLVVIVLRDRDRPGREPSASLRNPKLEIAYVLALAVIAGLLAWRTLEGVRDVSPVSAHAVPAPGAGPHGLTIHAVAAKWNWRFEYPGGVVEQGNGPAHPATLVVPYGGPVRFGLTSRDVVHAMWIPAARYKYDAIPGRTNVFDMQFERGRRYDDSRCSEYCGQYHAQMQFAVDVRSPAAFRAWLTQRQRALR